MYILSVISYKFTNMFNYRLLVISLSISYVGEGSE